MVIKAGYKDIDINLCRTALHLQESLPYVQRFGLLPEALIMIKSYILICVQQIPNKK